MSNSNAMASYDGGPCTALMVEASDTDTLLNNDYFYDDEFAVPFDVVPPPAPQLCRSLTDSCLGEDGGDGRGLGWRGGRLTLSRSESCLCRSADLDSQADEMMSTSERAAGDFLMTSSELSDLDAADHRPLFSPEVLSLIHI